MRRGAGGSFWSPRGGGDRSRVSRTLYGLHRVGETRDRSFCAGTQPPLRHQPAHRPPPWSGIQPAAEVRGRARLSPRLRPCARRRHGDSHKTLAPGAPSNGSVRRGETRTSLFQDGGASVASSRAGGKPAKPSKAAARDRTEAAVAAVGGGPGSFRCCYGCCHAARLGRTSLPRGVMMLTEVSGAQCLPERRVSGRRQPVTDAALGAGPDLSRSPAGQPPGSHKCHRVGAVLTRQSSTSSCRRSPSPELSLLRGVRAPLPGGGRGPHVPVLALVYIPGLRGPPPHGWVNLLAVAAGLSDSAFHPCSGCSAK